MLMNRLYVAVVMSLVQCSVVCAQLTAVKPSLDETPPPAFSSLIPSGSSWLVTIKSAAELRELKSPAASKDAASVANTQSSGSRSVAKIENAYRSGIRRETLIYSDGSKFTRYITNKEILFEHRVTGEPVFEEVGFSSTGPTTGVNELRELSWISNKYFMGSAKYQGRDCYVYRQFVPEQFTPPSLENENDATLPGVALVDLKDASNAKIQGTAFIDKETMKPIAYETIYESKSYDMQVPYSAFELPASIELALKTRAEVFARRGQSFNIRK
jgi:hypothetical protein